MKEIFITATDTDAGKTFISCAIIHALTQQEKLKVAAFKPIAAGCERVDDKLINEDAKLLTEFANCDQDISQVNPITFEEAIAPHIAANKHNQQISIEDITQHYQVVKNSSADVLIVEGAGGWRLPLGSEKNNPSRYQYLSDFAINEKHEVILIVNMKLGCLNHALLTFETIKADGLQCIAWVANCASDDVMSNLNENLAELERLLPVPNMGKISFMPDSDKEGIQYCVQDKIISVSKQLDVSVLKTN